MVKFTGMATQSAGRTAAAVGDLVISIISWVCPKRGEFSGMSIKM